MTMCPQSEVDLPFSMRLHSGSAHVRMCTSCCDLGVKLLHVFPLGTLGLCLGINGESL